MKKADELWHYSQTSPFPLFFNCQSEYSTIPCTATFILLPEIGFRKSLLNQKIFTGTNPSQKRPKTIQRVATRCSVSSK